MGELMSRSRKKIRHFYFLPHFLILFEYLVTTVLYGKDTLQIGEVESALLSNEKARRKLRTTQDLHFLLMVRIERERMRSKDLAVMVSLNPRIAERECSATSARSGDT